jgi:hypothetical protein
MWAQLIRTRLADGKGDEDLLELEDVLREMEEPGSGWVRTTMSRDQNDPSALYIFVLFESEEAARAREQDPSRIEGMQRAREIMGEIFATPPEFVDLLVVNEAHNE